MKVKTLTQLSKTFVIDWELNEHDHCVNTFINEAWVKKGHWRKRYHDHRRWGLAYED